MVKLKPDMETDDILEVLPFGDVVGGPGKGCILTDKRKVRCNHVIMTIVNKAKAIKVLIFRIQNYDIKALLVNA